MCLQSQLLTLWIALNCVTRAETKIQVFGYKGREAHISCPYGNGYQSYNKYLCRHPCAYEDVLIRTKDTKKKKYSIYDDKSSEVFITTISALQLNDAGKYWCGISRNIQDLYIEVSLEVEEDVCCDEFTSFERNEEDSLSFICSYNSEHQDNLKYVCRGNQTSTCLEQAVVTSDRPQNRTFTLRDDQMSRTFNVTIASLTLEDSGWYLCGVRRNSLGQSLFSAVEVKVKGLQRQLNTEVLSTEKQTSQPQIKTHETVFNPAFYILIPLLVLLLILVAVYAHRRTCKRTHVDVDLSVAFFAPPAGVRNLKFEKREPAEEMPGQEIYMNEVSAHHKQKTNKPHVACVNSRAADEEEWGSVYQNLNQEEDIYCNQSYLRQNEMKRVHF